MRRDVGYVQNGRYGDALGHGTVKTNVLHTRACICLRVN